MSKLKSEIMLSGYGAGKMHKSLENRGVHTGTPIF